MRGLLIVSLLLAAASLLAPSQPGYDAWAWLLWGRELAHLDLDTSVGPAFKPLPIAISAALSFAGDAAPQLWLLIARAGAIASVLLAGRLAHRLTDGSWVAAGVAACGVALCSGWWWHGAIGNSEGLFLALVLAAADSAYSGRHDRALAIAAAAALLRPESWPFLAIYGLWLWRREPALRIWLVTAGVAVPILWFVPELLGSGELLRSSERARIPNPGAPATAAFPFWESLRTAALIPLLPVAALAALSWRGAKPTGRFVWLAAPVAWVVLVAVMAQAGYSGEARYALVGAAALAVAAGLGAATLSQRWLIVVALIALPFAVVRTASLGAELQRSADDAALWGSLPPALDAAGGAAQALSCGPPATGRYRGSGVAYALGVHLSEVRADGAPVGGLLLRSRIRPSAPVSPPASAGEDLLSRSARWEIRC